MTPSLYHLLPSFEGALTVDDGLTADIFHPRAWQPSVVRTIEQQVRGWDVSASELFAGMLDEAQAHRTRISNLNLREDGEGAADGPIRDHVREDHWLAILGAGSETRIGLRVKRDDNGDPRFLLRSDERRNEWDSDDARMRRSTGDGTVPLQGALPPFLEESRLVCVTPGDFGYWELRDRSLSELAGLHGLIPKMNMLHPA